MLRRFNMEEDAVIAVEIETAEIDWWFWLPTTPSNSGAVVMVALVEHQRMSFLIFDWTMRPLVAPRVLQNSITRLKKFSPYV